MTIASGATQEEQIAKGLGCDATEKVFNAYSVPEEKDEKKE